VGGGRRGYPHVLEDIGTSILYAGLVNGKVRVGRGKGAMHRRNEDSYGAERKEISTLKKE